MDSDYFLRSPAGILVQNNPLYCPFHNPNIFFAFISLQNNTFKKLHPPEKSQRYQMPSIQHAILIAASAEKIYHAITSQEGLSAWWTPGATANAEINSLARFPFGDGYFKEMKIVELTPGQFVKWNCVKGDKEWLDTALTFRLETGNDKTLLNSHPEIKGQIEQLGESENITLLIFHHENWKDYTPMFAECNYTWGRFLWSLKLFCETGKGLPWPDQHRS